MYNSQNTKSEPFNSDKGDNHVCECVNLTESLPLNCSM